MRALDVDLKKMANRTTVVVRVLRHREFRLRLRVALWIIQAALRFAWLGCRIEVEGEE